MIIENSPDKELVYNIKNGVFENESINELKKRHLSLINYVVDSRICNESKSVKSDIVSEFPLIIFNTATKFDESKNAKFSTFLFKDITLQCMKAKNTMRAQNGTNANLVDYSLCDNEKFDASELFDAIDKIDNEVAKKIIRIRYFEPTNGKLTIWRKIGEQVNLSGQQCLNIHNDAIKKLRKKFVNG